MSKVKQIILYSCVAIFALGAGSLLRTLLSEAYQTELSSEESQQGAQAILSASLPDLQGENQEVSQWLGKVMVVNFWATWCTPCREEIPEFIEAQKKYGEQGLIFIGIAIDQADKVKMFSQEFGINYPVLVGSFNTWSLLEAAGNRHSALPYTVVINRSGELVENYLGRVDLKKLEKMVIPLLNEAPKIEQSIQTS
ncbi:TlpA family protein disulfide reductase [Nitrosomonas ureae]|uniref:Thiol-disulfide isomerase or thioredoxin n=1 Tax=Nitrosomonas ureae TaxID=44577 RepID=A0A1H9GG59_9PROT|nr:TlpA disulfide reductase family protein [Nitrosomonas ureae]PTQ88078.1 thiol-disulfide isomerase/thioredoxin [Nitrosomonas ureae]PXX17780.1 thiol-disulfide isomerase/thioredoxin [Nitrosomonas ureae]SEQ49084.1 Thiol-disulfide isomerase or thioredoxin [Nitrosomonas ureae]